MNFPFGQTIHRDRRQRVPDPYNPDRTAPAGDWADAATIELRNAWIGAVSTAARDDATRSAIVANASLYCDAGTDVQAGDRIRCAGHAYTVQAVPLPEVNPFTGWTPPLEVPLKEVTDR